MSSSIILQVLVVYTAVDGFTFPSDWKKIRQSMLERRLEENNEMSVGVRGSFLDNSDIEELVVIQRERVRSPPPLVQIDPLMEEVMRISNFTELEIRFSSNDFIQGRNSFGEPTPLPSTPFRGSDAVWNLTKSLIRSRLYEGSTGNSLFSPISILTALNILLLGTTGEIQQEMISTLGYPRYTGLVHSQFQQIIKSMNEDIGVTISTSNALFSQVNFPLEQRYKDELKFYYGDLVEIIPLDFTRRPISTMRIMNRYIRSKTKNLIANMFTEPVPQDSKLVISNALYFNGTWEYEFELSADYTGREILFNSFKTSIDITIMEGNMDFPFLADPEVGFQIASLPYEHDIRNEEISEAHMFFVLPTREGEEEYKNLEQKMTNMDWEDVFNRMDQVYGEIQIPRMKMEFQANLAPTLSNLGLKKLFSGRGSLDFSPLTPRWDQFKLDTLQHKTILKITEKGTEAAASTSAFQFRMIPSISFKLDRPFFLFIYDALNKVVIFWARVVEPTPLEYDEP
ncbi:serpin B4 isoform X2 [Eurytemora carolleeae]|uniref:serpin B4 isoform X2 n=1 Tax=Eurytemora carolleeae TaxID=1294199 RepID=UPI000C776403|nr:serpin B4 isoform X2 [Eurytemora carolleeae]|eukprot:XP_023328503.1 serpin B4-like isoform X2 [Eurytemora affinis]